MISYLTNVCFLCVKNRRKQKGKVKVEKEIARTLATKKIFSQVEFAKNGKSSHFNGEECFDNKLKDVQKSLQQKIVHTSELACPQKSVFPNETRFVMFRIKLSYFVVSMKLRSDDYIFY